MELRKTVVECITLLHVYICYSDSYEDTYLVESFYLWLQLAMKSSYLSADGLVTAHWSEI